MKKRAEQKKAKNKRKFVKKVFDGMEIPCYARRTEKDLEAFWGSFFARMVYMDRSMGNNWNRRAVQDGKDDGMKEEKKSGAILESDWKKDTSEQDIAEGKEENGAAMENDEGLELMEENITENDGTQEDESLAVLRPYLDERIQRAIKEMGFEKMTPIQVQAIPVLIEGKDMIGQAQTGTGKTAAFGIPILQKIDPNDRALQAIILCPTRELAIQAAEELRKLAKYMHGVKILPVYGGQDISRQITGLKGTQIVVGTPGRVMDHMRRHTLKLDQVNTVILDEADEMLDMGFREDMELILGEIPGEHQTALFSATMPQPILDITDKFQKDAEFIHVASKELTIPLVSQHYYRIRNKDKDAACIRVLEYYQPKLSLIFCNTKKKVDELAECLKQHGFQAEALHGDMSQSQRDVAMGRFRNGSTNILIATDVAARGIDVENVEAVINYDVPQDIEYYVHRIGRTGRAGKTGTSYTFVNGRELFRIRQIERFCRTTIDEWKLPNASKVLKAKAQKFLDAAWELRESEDMELMKKYISRKMEEEGCDAMDIAAVLLKYYVGEKGEEIEEDEDFSRRRREEEGRGRRRRGRENREEEKEGSNRRERRRREDRDEDKERAARGERRRRENRDEDKEGAARGERRRREDRDEEKEGAARGERRRREERDEEKPGLNREERRRRDAGVRERREKWDRLERSAERRESHGKGQERFPGENEGTRRSGMKKGKASEKGRNEGWWSGKKLPFSTREFKKR